MKRKVNEFRNDSRQPQLTFEDLAVQTRSGRAFIISGEGRSRKYGYRHGVTCRLGDIEQNEWQKMMLELIQRFGEDDLYSQLLTWLKEHNYCSESTGALEHKTLELHSMRIFEDEKWVDFIKFNQRFCLQTLDGVAVAYARCDCCDKNFMTTQALLNASTDGTTCCQICGRWSKFTLWGEDIYTVLSAPDEIDSILDEEAL